MTDKEKLDAIRAEIHRLVDVRGYDVEMANDLLAFMDSLPNEPVSEDLEKIVEEIAEPTILNAYGTKELARRLRNTICGTSVSEDLEKAAEDYGIRQGLELKPFAIKYFKAGANWQKQQDQSTIELAEDHAMLAGMEKMKEQMMAKAVEGGCFSYKNGFVHISCDIDEHLTDIKIGDKVKVIVIKEN